MNDVEDVIIFFFFSFQESPLIPSLAEEYKKKNSTYILKAKMWTERFACPQQESR